MFLIPVFSANVEIRNLAYELNKLLVNGELLVVYLSLSVYLCFT